MKTVIRYGKKFKNRAEVFGLFDNKKNITQEEARGLCRSGYPVQLLNAAGIECEHIKYNISLLPEKSRQGSVNTFSEDYVVVDDTRRVGKTTNYKPTNYMGAVPRFDLMFVHRANGDYEFIGVYAPNANNVYGSNNPNLVSYKVSRDFEVPDDCESINVVFKEN